MKKNFVELLNEGIIEQVEKEEASLVRGGTELQQSVYVHGELSLNQYDGGDGFAASTKFNIVCPNIWCGATNKVTGCGDK